MSECVGQVLENSDNTSDNFLRTLNESKNNILKTPQSEDIINEITTQLSTTPSLAEDVWNNFIGLRSSILELSLSGLGLESEQKKSPLEEKVSEIVFQALTSNSENPFPQTIGNDKWNSFVSDTYIQGLIEAYNSLQESQTEQYLDTASKLEKCL